MYILNLKEYLLRFDIKIELIKKIHDDWVDFHLSNKIIDLENIENVTTSKDNKKDLKELYSFDQLHKVEKVTVYNSIQCVLETSGKLICMFLLDCEYMEDLVYLIFRPLSNWSGIVKTILSFYSTDEESLSLIISRDYTSSIMSYHPFFDSLIQDFKGKKYTNKSTCNNYIEESIISYILPVKQYNVKFNMNMRIEMIVYNDFEKTDIFFSHDTDIFVISHNKKCCGKSRIDKCLDNDSYTIIFSDPIIYYKSNNDHDDKFTEMYITYKNIKKQIHTEDSYDLRLNKLLDKVYSYNGGHESVFSMTINKINCPCQVKYFHRKVPLFRYTSDELLYNYFKENLDIKKSKNIPVMKPKNFKVIDTKFKFDMDNVIDISNLFVEENYTKNNINKKICHNYVYLVEKYDINSDQAVYKFGKSNRPILERLKEHCYTSKVLLILEVEDANFTESSILKLLNNDKNIIKRIDLGNEYFLCENKYYLISLISKNV